jgi:hypothetical protein
MSDNTPPLPDQKGMLGTGHPNLIVETDYAREASRETDPQTGRPLPAYAVRVETRIPLPNRGIAQRLQTLLDAPQMDAGAITAILAPIIDSITSVPQSARARAKAMLAEALKP